MSLPLLRAVAAAGVANVLFRSRPIHALVAPELDRVTPHFLSDLRTARGLLAQAHPARRGFDLLLGVPQVPARALLPLKFLFGAKRVVAECDAVAPWWVDDAVAKSPVQPILEAQHALLRAAGIEPLNEPPRLRFAPSERSAAEAIVRDALPAGTEPVLALHAGSEKSCKRWPAECWAEVLRRLREFWPALGVVSLGTANERADSETVRSQAGIDRWCDGLGRWSLRQSASIVSICRIMLSADTGLMHIAAAAGVPPVAVFGPTSARRLFPAHAGGVAFAPTCERHPCYGTTHLPQCACIGQTSPEAVAAAALRLLARRHVHGA